MKKTTFAAFGAFALLAVSAPAQAADIPLWEQLSTGVTPAAEAAPVAAVVAADADTDTDTGFAVVPVAQAEQQQQPAVREKMSLWAQLTGKGKPQATEQVIAAPAAAPAVSEATTAYPAQGAMIEYRGVPNTFVIEIRENPAAAKTAAAVQAEEVQQQAQEIVAAEEIATQEAVVDAFAAEEIAAKETVIGETVVEETVAASEPAPVAFQPQTRQRMSLWEQLTGKGEQPAAAPAAPAQAASVEVEAAEAVTAPVATAPAAIEAQGAVAQEAPLHLWEKLAVEQPVVR